MMDFDLFDIEIALKLTTMILKKTTLVLDVLMKNCTCVWRNTRIPLNTRAIYFLKILSIMQLVHRLGRTTNYPLKNIRLQRPRCESSHSYPNHHENSYLNYLRSQYIRPHPAISVQCRQEHIFLEELLERTHIQADDTLLLHHYNPNDHHRQFPIVHCIKFPRGRFQTSFVDLVV